MLHELRLLFCQIITAWRRLNITLPACYSLVLNGAGSGKQLAVGKTGGGVRMWRKKRKIMSMPYFHAIKEIKSCFLYPLFSSFSSCLRC
jgi:hypothetical protein